MSREIEVKLLVEGGSFNQLKSLIAALITLGELDKLETGSYVDQYWKTTHADFLRQRVGKEPQLTAKKTGSHGIVNREEVQVPFDVKDADAMYDTLTLALGEPATLLWQFCDWHVGNYTVSLIKNHEDQSRLYIEVEGQSELDVRMMVSHIRRHLDEQPELKVFEVKNSFFSIYVKQEGPKV